jgi:hypothetical protein
MTRRDTGFLLIGLGIGLILAAAVAIADFVWLSHHMFIMGVRWGQLSVVLAAPLLMVISGSALLLRYKGKPKSALSHD